jgi:hypothetical protein
MKDASLHVPIILSTGYVIFYAWKPVEVWILQIMHLLVQPKSLSR